MTQAKEPDKNGNLRIWESLGKTDPGQTKGFSRSGGFKGTAVKPMWITKRLTEEFGPCGVGWGINEPRFEMVHGLEETLVYCTVSAWHGSRDQIVWGVGGDKAIGKNRNGVFTDDEAFKKAFTDAIGNAFKFIGVAADIHMGLFDDSKYVEQMRHEFSDANDDLITRDQVKELEKLAEEVGANLDAFCGYIKVPELAEIRADKFDAARELLSKKRKQPSQERKAA